jgi:Na+/melibiose symporter-like transporter
MLGKVFLLFLFTLFIDFFAGLAFGDFKSRLGMKISFWVTTVVSTITNGLFLLMPLPLTRFAEPSSTETAFAWFLLLIFPAVGYWLFRFGWSIAPSTVEKERLSEVRKNS